MKLNDTRGVTVLRRDGCTAGSDEECLHPACATRCPAHGVSVRAEPSSQRINELARQSGLPMSWLDTGKASAWPELERFARLVLADGVRVLPPHLREDAKPLSQCSKCGRKSWDATEAEKTCGMPQPNGYQCAGIMDPDGVAEAGRQVIPPASTDASSPAVRKAEDKLTESGSCIAARTALKESDQ